MAQTSKNTAHQVLALRGYVRLVQIPSSRPQFETAKMLAAGMAAAKRPEEKKIVIAAAQRVIAPESLALVRTVLSDVAVSRGSSSCRELAGAGVDVSGKE